MADYEDDPVELSDAREMVEQAEIFVAAMRAEFMPEESSDSDSGAGSGRTPNP